MIDLPRIEFSDVYSVDDYKICEKEPGIYRLYNKDMKLMYIGKAKFLGARVKQHSTGDKGLNHNYFFFDFCELNCHVDREIYETYYINLLMPPINRSKVFLYDSTTEEYFSDELKKQLKEEEENFLLKAEEQMKDFCLYELLL